LVGDLACTTGLSMLHPMARPACRMRDGYGRAGHRASHAGECSQATIARAARERGDASLRLVEVGAT
jgi:hypothetical protein